MADIKIVFLILPHIHLLDLAGPDQVFLEAIGYGAPVTLEYCSFENDIRTSTGLPFGKLKHFSKVKLSQGDYIFIPGAEVDYLKSAAMKAQKDLAVWVTAAYNRGSYICSVCTGAFFLAMTGLLDGKKCTTHWKRTAELQAMYPSILLQENILFTEDERIFTSAGVTAGIDMALHITGRIMDDNFSYKVARELVIYIRRQGDEVQQSIYMKYRNHIHSGIHKVQDHLLENINRKNSLHELADVACMSARNLTRVFKKEIGISVNEYITLIRKDRLRELLKDPDITRLQIAKQCGLTSQRQVARLKQSL
jgi:transcriptional regulator GlxA family with amidase domain